MRNVIVHRAGLVDKKFLLKVPSYAGQAGDKVRLGTADVFENVQFFVDSARYLDYQAIERFDLAVNVPDQIGLFDLFS